MRSIRPHLVRTLCESETLITGGRSAMFSRRTFLSLVAGSMAAPRLASAQASSQKVALYANVGADLTHYDVDVAGAELIKRATVTLPAAVQYAWPHVSRRVVELHPWGA